MNKNAIWALVLVLGLASTHGASERRLQQSGLLQQPLTGAEAIPRDTLGTVGLGGPGTGGSSASSTDTAGVPSKMSSSTPAAASPTGDGMGFLSAGADDSEMEAQLTKVDEPDHESAGMSDPLTAPEGDGEPSSTTEPATAAEVASDVAPAASERVAAEAALVKAGLLPNIHGKVYRGSGGQADYGNHKDYEPLKRVLARKEVPDGQIGGGGFADYVDNKKGINIHKSEGPVDDVIIPAGYANYGTPKLEVDVSFNKAGESVVCHFPSPLLQGTGANPYTVKPLTMPAPLAKLFVEKQKGKTFDFPAPPPGRSVFGPGCVRYDNNCDFGGEVACNGRGVCDSSLPNQCICFNGRATCQSDSSGCETNTLSSSANCGACGVNCFADPDLGFEACCNGQCTDFDSRVNCGACGNLCLDIGGNATCVNKTCDITCNPDTPTKCVGSFNSSGITSSNVTYCANLNTSLFACGSCNRACPTDANALNRSCVNGICDIRCVFGTTQCSDDTNIASSCSNLRTDPTNCGTCGNRCPGPVAGSGTPICVGGVCDVICNSGTRCVRTDGLIECQNLNSDVRNCGICFRPCLPPNDFVCESGACVQVFTAGGFVFAEKKGAKGPALAPGGWEDFPQGNDSLGSSAANWEAAYARGAPASGPAREETEGGLTTAG